MPIRMGGLSFIHTMTIHTWNHQAILNGERPIIIPSVCVPRPSLWCCRQLSRMTPITQLAIILQWTKRARCQIWSNIQHRR
ncbi:hypothetical protein DMENIID0001_014360 [Sergentomyia squamirostris]